MNIKYRIETTTLKTGFIQECKLDISNLAHDEIALFKDKAGKTVIKITQHTEDFEEEPPKELNWWAW